MEIASALEVSLKMVRHNKEVRRLFGAEYPIKIVPYINLIDACMKKYNCNFVKAIRELEKDGISVDMLLAAAYEILLRDDKWKP